ncbi:MAG: ribosome assembly cofactor RimP [Treponema sp.]|jgi:ribosome maturation factor RimP|nr:ribosome assembly cofactor RimP [Treponema sp.]
MRYKAREMNRDSAALTEEVEPVVRGLGFALVELDLYRSGRSRAGRRESGGHRGSVRVRIVVARPPEGPSAGGSGPIGTADLSRLHRALLPRLELTLEGRDLSVELSSPGTDRLIREGAEFRHFTGRPVRCYRTDTSAWQTGILRGLDREKIFLETEEGITEVKYETIAKARLN